MLNPLAADGVARSQPLDNMRVSPLAAHAAWSPTLLRGQCSPTGFCSPSLPGTDGGGGGATVQDGCVRGGGLLVSVAHSSRAGVFRAGSK